MLIKELGEFSFIESIRGNSIKNKETVKVGIGDDCAVYVAEEGTDQLITTDTMVEGIHFNFSIMRPYDIGFRLAAANFSDIAAMGGDAKQVVLSVAVHKDMDVKQLQGVFDGVKSQCEKFNVNFIGGDVTETAGPLVLAMTVIGEAPKDKAVLRSGAKVDEWIGVTNTLGGSATGLDVLVSNEKGYFASKDAYQRPVPQLELGKFLREQGVSSMEDISDGLVRELYDIANQSSVRLMIFKEQIPIHSETVTWAEEKGVDPLDYALYGGEDFQLLFTASTEVKEKLEGHPLIHFFGRVKAGEPSVILRDEREDTTEVIPLDGYEHFRS